MAKVQRRKRNQETEKLAAAGELLTSLRQETANLERILNGVRNTLLTKSLLAEHMRIGTTAIDKFVREGLPYREIAGQYLFYLPTVIEFLLVKPEKTGMKTKT